MEQPGSRLRSIEIENWCIDIADRVVRGALVEDDRAELKSSWIDTSKAAQRIAAHANSVSPERALWIIGLDETGQQAKGASKLEFADWWPQVEARFDGKAPGCQMIVVPYNNVELVALLFDTSEAPFVVKNPKHDHLEVLWREGTRTRPARRQDLVRLLAPRLRQPKLICDHAFLRVQRWQAEQLKFDLSMNLLFVCYDDFIRTFLNDEITATLGLAGGIEVAVMGLSYAHGTASSKAASNSAPTRYTILRQTQVLQLSFKTAVREFAGEIFSAADVVLRMNQVDSIVPLVLTVPIVKTNDLGHEFGFALSGRRISN